MSCLITLRKIKHELGLVQIVHNARKTQTDASNWDCSSMLSLSELTDGWLRTFSDTINPTFTRKLKKSSLKLTTEGVIVRKLLVIDRTHRDINFKGKNMLIKLWQKKNTNTVFLTFSRNAIHQWKKKFMHSGLLRRKCHDWLSIKYLISKISKQAFSYSVRFLTIHTNQIQQFYLTLVFLHNTNVCKKVMITNA